LLCSEKVSQQDSASRRRYPVTCPTCGALQGYPTAVQTVRSKPGHIRIDVVCQACRKQWSEEADIEDP
jgi:DNA-directed RNA polymerase subunit M/transcription elongation factor TFIIS